MKDLDKIRARVERWWRRSLITEADLKDLTDLMEEVDVLTTERDAAVNISTGNLAWKAEKARAETAEKERDDAETLLKLYKEAMAHKDRREAVALNAERNAAIEEAVLMFDEGRCREMSPPKIAAAIRDLKR